jgi:hypothetical protein
LGFAISRSDQAMLSQWGNRTAGRFIMLAGRRISTLSDLITRLGHAGSTELKGFLAALRQSRFNNHLGNRTAAAIDGSIGLARDASRLVSGIGNALLVDPKGNAPKVLSGFLGFYAGSGGIDGDGGIPDLDLLAGIDAHRSILTHSILAGVVAEGLLLAIVDLASEVHDRLPLDHDPLWDKLAESASPLTGALTAGASAGIAYHLLVDAFIQPAPYHGLPLEMSMEAHQGIMGANGATEGAYAASQMRNERPALLHQGPPSGASTGRKVVDFIGRKVDQATRFGNGLVGGLKY